MDQNAYDIINKASQSFVKWIRDELESVAKSQGLDFEVEYDWVGYEVLIPKSATIRLTFDKDDNLVIRIKKWKKAKVNFEYQANDPKCLDDIKIHILDWLKKKKKEDKKNKSKKKISRDKRSWRR